MCACPSTLALSQSPVDNSCAWKSFNQTNDDGTFPKIRSDLLKLWSVFNFQNLGTKDPATHFFDTFNLFDLAASLNKREGLEELRDRAMSENIQYIELMTGVVGTPPGPPKVGAWAISAKNPLN